MQKEQLLNLLNPEARQVLENAKQLAQWRGGVLSPLHLLIAALEQAVSGAARLSGEPARLLLAAHETLNARFPLPGTSITITRETRPRRNARILPMWLS